MYGQPLEAEREPERAAYDINALLSRIAELEAALIGLRGMASLEASLGSKAWADAVSEIDKVLG